MGFLLPFAATAMGASAATASTMATIGSVISEIGTVAGAIGQFAQGEAKSSADKYNATIASNNAKIAEQNAEFKSREGEQQAAIEEQKTRAKVGAIQANQAAAGVDVNTGSAVDVRSSAASLGELNAITIRSNAAREAYGYQTQASNDKAQAAMDSSMAGKDLMAGVIGGATTFLGGTGANINQYDSFMMNQGLNTSDIPTTGWFSENE